MHQISVGRGGQLFWIFWNPLSAGFPTIHDNHTYWHPTLVFFRTWDWLLSGTGSGWDRSKILFPCTSTVTLNNHNKWAPIFFTFGQDRKEVGQVIRFFGYKKLSSWWVIIVYGVKAYTWVVCPKTLSKQTDGWTGVEDSS